jgi:hypothetical protein
LETPETIRLIVLKPYKDKASESIKCDVRRIRIDQTQYTALSYEWGPPANDDPKIRLDGHITVVRRNLFRALLSLRRRWQDWEPSSRGIWIDAISINQADTQERNHQVRLMGTIYRVATHVLVWPGFSKNRDHQAIAVINTQVTQSSTGDDEVLGCIDPILELCRREYWNRVWIQQEIYLANKVLIMWGWNKFINYEGFNIVLGVIT